MLRSWYLFQPVYIRYVGLQSVDLLSSALVSNGDCNLTSLHCLQVYTDALSLRQFLYTRDSCLVPSKLFIVTVSTSV